MDWSRNGNTHTHSHTQSKTMSNAIAGTNTSPFPLWVSFCMSVLHDNTSNVKYHKKSSSLPLLLECKCLLNINTSQNSRRIVPSDRQDL